jgi:endonuclease/exonuclease/phosphatase (EEP) superfamily protein YafD
VFSTIVKFGLVIYVISALLPVLKFDDWWVRIWDFPRLQLLALGVTVGIIYFFTSSDPVIWIAILMGYLTMAVVLDLYRILPYTPLWRSQSLSAALNSSSSPNSLSILIANVLQPNQEAGRLLNLINAKAPDLVLLLEVNRRWLRDLKSLEATYQFQLKEPLENLYGIALYSRLPFQSATIRYLVEKDVPSVYAKLRLRSKQSIEIFGLHPKPPRPDTGATTKRDGELIMVAKKVSKQTTPIIVMGDLNDVAWSHTTRLFQRLSGLIDPRVGRGHLPTFPVNYPFFRFPLDHLFHSPSFRLNAVERLPSIGSDHFPLFVSLHFEPTKAWVQEGPSPEVGDLEEANETMKKATEGEKA